MARMDRWTTLRRRATWLWLAYWVMAFALTHVPKVPNPGRVIPHGDKLAHFLLYFVLVILGDWAIRGRGRRPAVRTYITWAIAYACYAGVDEWLQQFVHRHASVGDWIADLSGILVATLLLALRRNVRISDPAASTK